LAALWLLLVGEIEVFHRIAEGLPRLAVFTAQRENSAHALEVVATFVVPIEINGAITLDFTVDSGAADVSVPAGVFSTLMRTGTIKASEISLANIHTSWLMAQKRKQPRSQSGR
jgi:hypothetical protein